MLEKFKELAKDNWKAAVAGALATLVALFTGMNTVPFQFAEMVVDEDVKARICAPEEAAEEKADTPIKEEADAGAPEEADAGAKADTGADAE